MQFILLSYYAANAPIRKKPGRLQQTQSVQVAFLLELKTTNYIDRAAFTTYIARRPFAAIRPYFKIAFELLHTNLNSDSNR